MTDTTPDTDEAEATDAFFQSIRGVIAKACLPLVAAVAAAQPDKNLAAAIARGEAAVAVTTTFVGATGPTVTVHMWDPSRPDAPAVEALRIADPAPSGKPN
jgi:hypothetical protein